MKIRKKTLCLCNSWELPKITCRISNNRQAFLHPKFYFYWLNSAWIKYRYKTILSRNTVSREYWSQFYFVFSFCTNLTSWFRTIFEERASAVHDSHKISSPMSWTALTQTVLPQYLALSRWLAGKNTWRCLGHCWDWTYL